MTSIYLVGHFVVALVIESGDFPAVERVPRRANEHRNRTARRTESESPLLYYQSFYEVDMKPGDELSEFLDTDWVEGESDDVVRERVNQGQQTGLRQVVSF